MKEVRERNQEFEKNQGCGAEAGFFGGAKEPEPTQKSSALRLRLLRKEAFKMGTLSTFLCIFLRSNFFFYFFIT